VQAAQTPQLMEYWSESKSERGSTKRSSDFCGCHNNWKKISPLPSARERKIEGVLNFICCCLSPTYCAKRRSAHSATFGPRQLTAPRTADAKSSFRIDFAECSTRYLGPYIPLTNYAIRSNSRATFCAACYWRIGAS
jgi:hypothetical protein